VRPGLTGPRPSRRVTGLVRPRQPSPTEHLPGSRTDPAPEDLRERWPAELATREVLRAAARLPAPGRLGRLTLRPAHLPAVRSRYLEVLGQRHVGRLLDSLGPAWHVLHAVPILGRGADHLLIGPTGVVVVDAAHHPGARVVVQGRQVRVDGTPAAHVRRVERLVAEVTTALGGDGPTALPVRGVVVVHGARALTVRDLPPGLHALTSGELGSWLRARPTVLSSVDAARVADVAARPSTWGEADDGLDPAGRAARRVEERTAVDALGRRGGTTVHAR
jgi:hypothetical protein